MLMNKTGNKLDEIKTDLSSIWGYHAVTYDGDLLYIDESNNSIKKYTSDRKTTTVIITTGAWTPCSVYSSHSTGDILVGMISVDGRVVRYNKEGRELWQSQYNAQGQRLYGYPNYITENVNGDICTSNGILNKGVVVVVDRDGNHRFSYRGRQDGSKFNPLGICTDVHGRILVVVNLGIVHMIDQNGEFITVLLTSDHGISCNYGLCTDRDNNIWLCGLNRVKMYNWLRQNSSPKFPAPQTSPDPLLGTTPESTEEDSMEDSIQPPHDKRKSEASNGETSVCLRREPVKVALYFSSSVDHYMYTTGTRVSPTSKDNRLQVWK
ncbi:uncharacterized protein LOC130050614 [Ostrea edulis]|uniref:uncharacterized protein LOC130050614 n=1 Tax=Ostrea edulis TaxID=37623 RepID=UPI0024AF3D2A|nr:uncharacterized protein LOC130050614 [Ostrea edulis]